MFDLTRPSHSNIVFCVFFRGQSSVTTWRLYFLRSHTITKVGDRRHGLMLGHRLFSECCLTQSGIYFVVTTLIYDIYWSLVLSMWMV